MANQGGGLIHIICLPVTPPPPQFLSGPLPSLLHSFTSPLPLNIPIPSILSFLPPPLRHPPP